jgi:hypothetical protein
MAAPALPRSLTQAKHLQLLAYDVTIALRKDLDAASGADARAKLARALRDGVSAWDTARDAARVLRGKGLPKAEPERIKRLRQVELMRESWTGPIEVPPRRTHQGVPRRGIQAAQARLTPGRASGQRNRYAAGIDAKRALHALCKLTRDGRH